MVKQKVKPNAIAIESGNLLERVDVFKWLKRQQKQYHLTLLIGAGEQTSNALEKGGYESKFCPLGRVTESLKERELCEQVARACQAIVQDHLDRKGITVRVLTPFDYSDDVLVPVNGDVAMLGKYIGYDKIFRLTTKKKVKAKKRLIKRAAWAFAPIAGKNGIDMQLRKIEVIGF